MTGTSGAIDEPQVRLNQCFFLTNAMRCWEKCQGRTITDLQTSSRFLKGTTRSTFHVQTVNGFLQAGQIDSKSTRFGNQKLVEKTRDIINSSIESLDAIQLNLKIRSTHLPCVYQIVKITASHHQTILNVTPIFCHGRIALLDRLAAGNIRSLLHFLDLIV